MSASPSAGASPAPRVFPPVDVVRWPAEADRRAELAAAAVPRLLVIDAATPPPLCWDDLEDWVREPASPDEVQVRSWTLAQRAARQRGDDVVTGPVLDTDGVLRHGDEWVAVPALETRLLAPLLHRAGEVVQRHELLAAGWPHGAADDHVLDGRIKTLRRRLRRLGIQIHTVRGTGFLLERS